MMSRIGLFIALFFSLNTFAAPSKSDIIKQTVWIETAAGQGSGVILKKGVVLTAAHVCDGALVVRDYTGTRHDVVNIIPDFESDLCLVFVPTLPRHGNPLFLAPIHDLVVGDNVWYSGFPLGAWRISGGMVRKEGWYVKGTTLHYEIDTACDPGNSGGPVYDKNGRLVGIVVRAWTSSIVEFYGFCLVVPHSTIYRFLKERQ